MSEDEDDDDGLQEVIDEFVAESYEGLDQIDSDLVVIEADPGADEVLARVFRALHTIKGTCSFLPSIAPSLARTFQTLESLSHSAETLLTKMRDGSVIAGDEVINALLAASDGIRVLLATIERAENIAEDYSALERRLNALADGETPPAEDSSAASVEDSSAASVEDSSAASAEPLKEEPVASPSPVAEPAPAVASDDLDDGFGEVIPEFLAESFDGLDLMGQDLIVLESAPGNREVLERVFRTIHTIKGTCSFLSFPKLEWLSHAGENLLSRLRDGTLSANPQTIKALQALADAQREILASIESTGEEGLGEYGSLADQLNDLADAEVEGAGRPAPKPAAADAAAPSEALLATASAKKGATATSTTASSATPAKPRTNTAAPRSASPEPQISESSVRVDVTLLDQLMNLVGELVLARNRVLEFGPVHDNRSYNTTIQQLNHITSELQGGVMKTRMQPIGDVWKKFPRLVRDLTRAFGKTIQLEMVGAETELDRSLLQAIRDPLTHVLRNSVDHGIEMPEVRVANGKPEYGSIVLRAYHQGGQVIIEVADDGAGMSVDKVREKAISRGLATPEVVAEMSDREVSNLIFVPGFSTAEKVTAVSGRGVGMDVVKTNIEKVGGSIDFQNRPGQGTTMRFRIPLTLAIIPALFVWAKEELYAIPQTSLLELVRTRGGTGSGAEGIEFIHGTPVFRLRGRLLPLIFLNRELELDMRSPEECAAGGQFNIVVLRTENQDVGLVVDEILNTGEIVVKALGASLEELGVFAGATITGSGQVALILDVARLAERAGVISDTREIRSPTATLEPPTEESHEEMLLLRGRDDGRMALPLSKLERLEEFDASEVQRTGSRMVVKYRDGVLALVGVSELLEERRGEARSTDLVASSESKIQVVICTAGDHEVGLVTDRVLDIVRVSTSNLAGSTREGVLGTVIINDAITELLDVDLLLTKARDMGLDLAECSLRV